VSSTFDEYILGTGPLSFWPCKETAGASEAKDVVAEANNLVAHNCTFGATGIGDTESAVELNGTTSYLEAASPAQTVRAPYTMMIAASPKTLSKAGVLYMLSTRNNAAHDTFALAYNGEEELVEFAIGTGSSYLSSNLAQAAGTLTTSFHLVVMTVTEGGVEVDLNGQMIGRASWSSATAQLWVAAQAAIIVGKEGAGGFWEGSLAKGAVWTRALNHAERIVLYEKFSRTEILPANSATATIVRYWEGQPGTLSLFRHNEKSGTNAYDTFATSVQENGYRTKNKSQEQEIKIEGAPTGGTFKLSWEGHETAALNFNATRAQIETALAALTGMSTHGMTVTEVNATTFKMVLTLVLGPPQPGNLTLSSNLLTGGASPTVHLANLTARAGTAGFTVGQKGLITGDASAGSVHFLGGGAENSFAGWHGVTLPGVGNSLKTPLTELLLWIVFEITSYPYEPMGGMILFDCANETDGRHGYGFELGGANSTVAVTQGTPSAYILKNNFTQISATTQITVGAVQNLLVGYRGAAPAVEMALNGTVLATEVKNESGVIPNTIEYNAGVAAACGGAPTIEGVRGLEGYCGELAIGSHCPGKARFANMAKELNEIVSANSFKVVSGGGIRAAGRHLQAVRGIGGE
jgi:hypothetical protein